MKHRTASAVAGVLMHVFERPWRIISLSLLATMVWMSFAYGIPTDTFARSPVYILMQDVAPEDVWAVGFGLCALLRLAAYWYRPGWFIILADCCCAFMLILCVVCLLYSGGPGTPSIGAYSVLAVQAIILTMRRLFIESRGVPQ